MATAIQASGYNAAQIATIKATVASDTNDTEFNLFMEACRSYRLDPFRKQIFAVVYSKNDPKKRKMSIIVSRDGYRILAQRCGDYRPASEAAQIIYDADAKSQTNPKGIVAALVRLWKQDNRGDWYPVVGEAYWDEFAPIKDEWADDGNGKRKPTGKATLDTGGNWGRMPIVMITKCAESQALRAGWPDQFGGVYSEEEFDHVHAAQTASEALEQYQREERQARIGGPGLMFAFDDTMVLEKVALGTAADRIIEFLQGADPLDAHKFRIRNEQSLRELWGHDSGAALEVKKVLEGKETQLKKNEAA